MKVTSSPYSNCDPLVKKAAMGSHNRCNFTKRPSLVNGGLLNGYFQVQEFKEDKEYLVYSNMPDRLKKNISPKRTYNTRSQHVATIEVSKERATAEQPELVGKSGVLVQRWMSRRLNPSAMLYKNTF